MRTASSRQCHINYCREAVYGYDQWMEIFGSTGMLLNENLRSNTVRRWGKTETEVRDPLLNFFLERFAKAYKAELEQFVDALESGSPCLLPPRTAARRFAWPTARLICLDGPGCKSLIRIGIGTTCVISA